MKDMIQNLKENTPLACHPYFHALCSARMSKKQFIVGQCDFYHAVVYFTRPMMILAARFDSYSSRWSILENIQEEHGQGLLQNTHGASFARLMHGFGVSKTELHDHEPHAAVEIFNLSLTAIASRKDWRFAVAVFGIIEDRFSEISAVIGRSILKNAWLCGRVASLYATRRDRHLSCTRFL